MGSIVEIDKKIQRAQEKRRAIIITAMDGRTQKYVSEAVNVDEPRLSKWINGIGTLEDDELNRLTEYLGVDCK